MCWRRRLDFVDGWSSRSRKIAHKAEIVGKERVYINDVARL
jgi:hypothetical protein